VAREKVGFNLKAFKGKGEDLLVVDDVAEQRELASQMLTRLGYRVHTAENGEAAISFVEAQRVDLVVLDMIMDPGIDGLETYARLSRVQPGIKAIIASGFSQTDRIQAAQELGAGGYLKKPYTLEKLATAIRQELNS
jgi:CheY-like chemotaxis protein